MFGSVLLVCCVVSSTGLPVKSHLITAPGFPFVAWQVKVYGTPSMMSGGSGKSMYVRVTAAVNMKQGFVILQTINTRSNWLTMLIAMYAPALI